MCIFIEIFCFVVACFICHAMHAPENNLHYVEDFP